MAQVMSHDFKSPLIGMLFTKAAHRNKGYGYSILTQLTSLLINGGNRKIRLLRLIRAFRSTQSFIHHVFKNKAQGTFTSAILAILLIIFSSIAILQVEKDPASNIRSAEDAIWWAYVTITTVGYGDKYPVTTEGRVIAAVLMTAGVGLSSGHLRLMWLPGSLRKSSDFGTTDRVVYF